MTCREEYAARVNRVMDYIETHLDQNLTLEQLAGVACFSPFHFHRVFKAMTGETLNRHVARLRVEKAATRLLANPGASITDIALDGGFSSSAVFARAFRDHFGVSAGEWRDRHGGNMPLMGENRNPGKTDRKIGKDAAAGIRYIAASNSPQRWRMIMNDGKETLVEVRDLPALEVAYVRHIGPYAGDGELFGRLFTRLMTWAGPRGLIGPETAFLSVYHDDPNVTEVEKLRISVCVGVPPETPAEGEIGRMTIPGGAFAIARFEILPHEYEAAWNAVYGGWLPDSGYQPDDRLCFERYLNDPQTHPEGRHIVEICVPVRPL